MAKQKNTAIKNRVLELRWVKASELRPNPKNWRTHSKHQAEALDEVLGRLGIVGAMIVRLDPTGGYIILDGHLRQSRLGSQLVPVLVVDITAEEEDLFLATYDPLSLLAGTNPRSLQSLLEGLDASSEGLRGLLASLSAKAGEAAGRIEPEDIPEDARPRSKRGALYEMGSHRILCDDAADPTAVARLLGQERARLLVTDPPFGVKLKGRGPETLEISGDDAGAGALAKRVIEAVTPHFSPGAFAYMFHPSASNQIEFLQALTSGGWKIRQSLVWVKDSMVLGHADWQFRHEPIAYANLPGKGRIGRGGTGWYGGHSEQSVIEVPRPKASPLHPSAKPVELIRRLVSNSAAPNDIVLDPFLGSGSTLIAAEQTGRRCFGIEIDPRYMDVVLTRWERFTGKKARRI
ncbi:MAG: DNA modification methylase [Actinomycetota bacterium]